MKTEQSIEAGALRDTFKGQVLLSGDQGYETYRRVWNAMIDRRPALILRCADTADVAEAIRFARERDLLVTVRGGGHNAAGLAVADDGVMIDLSGMRNVAVDPFARRAVVQGGATWKDVDLATQRHGLAVTGGHVGSTGVGGLTLGGGFGWLHGAYGLTSDNLVAAEVVTADGGVVRASEAENADLFWGLRGGGGNFGIVTSFEFGLHELDNVFVGAFFWPRERAAELIEAYDAFTADVPDPLTTAFAMTVAEDEGNELIPPELFGREITLVFVVYPGATPEEGESAVRPLRDLGPVAELVTPMPYTDLQLSQDAVWKPGMSFYWKSGRLNAIEGGAGKTLVDSASGTYITALIQLGGAIARRPHDATAYAHRDARFQYLVAQLWDESVQPDGPIASARRAYQEMEPHVAGAFVNFLSDDIEERVDDALGSHGRRLQQIKKQYDPDNFFRMNANIKPT